MTFRRDVGPWDELPPVWFSYGKITPELRGEPQRDYWQLRFPSYRMMRDLPTGQFRWHQLVFVSVSHGEWFLGNHWKPGRRLHFGFTWFLVERLST